MKIPYVSPNVESRCVLIAGKDVCGGITVLITHFGISPDEHRQGVKKVITPDTSALFLGDIGHEEGDITNELFTDKKRQGYYR